MHDIDPEKAAGAFIALVFGGVRIAMAVIEWQNKRKMQRINSIPPTVCPVPEQPKRPSEGTVIATARRIWDLEQEAADLRARLAALDADRKAVAADAVRTAAALGESERRNEALSAELETLRKEIEGGHTRLDVSQSHVALRPIDVVEISDEKTPQQGKGIRR